MMNYDLFNTSQYNPQFGNQYDQYFTLSPQAPPPPASLAPIFARQYAQPQPQPQQRAPINYAPRTNRDMVTERGLVYADAALRCASLRRTAPVVEPYHIHINPRIGRYLPFNLEPL